MGTVGIKGKLLINRVPDQTPPIALFTFNQHLFSHHTNRLRMTL